MKNMPVVLLAACVLGGMSACGMEGKPAADRPAGGPAADAGKGGEAEGVVRIDDTRARFLTIEEAGATAMAERIAIPARLEMRAQAVSSLGAPVAGRVVSVRVRPGERVSAGAVLVTLQSADAAGARAGLAQAQARAAAAEEGVKRHDDMMARGVGTELERIEARTRLSEARAELERVRRLGQFFGEGSGDVVSLRAAAAGVVTAVKVSAGAIVAPGGEALVEMGNPSQLWAVADVTEADAAVVERGQPVTILLPSVNRRLLGRVDGMGARIDAETRRMPVYVAIDGDLRGLTPGLQAELSLTKGTRALSLPVTAVLIKDGRRRVVYVQREGGTYEPREVRTGEAGAGRVLILEGLRAGERVVTKGALLVDGEAEQLL